MRGAGDVPEPDGARVGLAGAEVLPEALVGFGDHHQHGDTDVRADPYRPAERPPLGEAPGIPTAPPARPCTKKASKTWYSGWIASM